MFAVISAIALLLGAIFTVMSTVNPGRVMYHMFQRARSLPFTTGSRNVVRGVKGYRIYWFITGVICILFGANGFLFAHSTQL